MPRKKKVARRTPIVRLRIRSTRFADRKKKANKFAARGRTHQGQSSLDDK